MTSTVPREVYVLLIYEDEMGFGWRLQEFILRRVEEKAKEIVFRWDVLRNVDIRLENADLFRSYDVIVLHNMSMPPPDGLAILKFFAANDVRVPILWASFGVKDEAVRSVADSLMYCAKFDKWEWYRDDAFVNLIRRVVKEHPIIRRPTGVIVCPTFDEAALRKLAGRSTDLFGLPPRKFEELLAQLLSEAGWEVELCPIGADGGIDIVAIRSVAPVSHRMLVQAKRYAPHRKVGVQVVREILYLVNDKGFSSGLIATTSAFTSIAVQERELHPWRLQLKDHTAIAEWLNRHVAGKTVLKVDDTQQEGPCYGSQARRT